MSSNSANLVPEAEALIQRGKEARAAREYSQAATCYEQAAAAFESLGDTKRSEHCLRHSAEIWLHVGNVPRARTQIGEVLNSYRSQELGNLEMGNALRVAALVAEAAQDPVEARSLWTEAREIYLAVADSIGTEAGVVEADRHLKALPHL